MMICEQTAFEELAKRLWDCGSFALDTEFIRERTYRPRLCLVQIAIPDETFLVDPLAVENMDPLNELIESSRVETVVHSGEQDFEIFFARSGSPPRRIFDTQVAAALAGHGQQISYGRLVEKMTGVRLRKVETFTDWAQRPLTPEQSEYALDDVRYLLQMRDSLNAELAELGRLDWLGDEVSRLETVSTYRKDRRTLYRRVKGAARLKPGELAVLRELAAWREEEAEERDRPRGHIIRDELLVEMSRRAPKNLSAIQSVRGLHPQLVKRCGEEILRRVTVGLAVPRSEAPTMLDRGPQDDDLDLIVDLLELVLKTRAREASIASPCLGTRGDLTRLARQRLRGEPEGGEPLALLSGWRKTLIGDTLLEILAGSVHAGVNARGRVELLRAK